MSRHWLLLFPLGLIAACTPAGDGPKPQTKVEAEAPATSTEAKAEADATKVEVEAEVETPTEAPATSADANAGAAASDGEDGDADAATDPSAASQNADRDFSTMFTLSDGVRMHATVGPFASVSALCEVLAEDPQPCDVVVRRAAPIPGLAGVSELAVIVAGEPGISSVDASLALHTDEGWFVAHRFEHLEHSTHGDTSSSFSLSGTKSIALAPGRDAMQLTFATKLRSGGTGARRKGSIVCTAADSGRPRCTTAIPTALDGDLLDDQTIGLHTTFPGDGTVKIELADPADAPDVRYPAILGEHRLGESK